MRRGVNRICFFALLILAPLRRDEGILYNSSYWRPNSRYMKSSLLLILLSIHFQAQAKDYAVVVTGTDTYSLQVNLKNNSTRTAALYKEKGYDRIFRSRF